MQYNQGDVVETNGCRFVVNHKLSDEEKAARAFMANPNAGDYYELTSVLDPQYKPVVWAARLKRV